MLVMHCLCERLYSVEKGLVYSRLYLPQNPQWRFPVWESCVYKLVEILLCEDGDVELCARTSKHISVFAFNPLSLTLTFTLCIDSYCLYHIHAWFVCVCPYLCLTKRASHSTSTLIQRNQKKLAQSPSTGIRLHSVITLSMLHLVL